MLSALKLLPLVALVAAPLFASMSAARAADLSVTTKKRVVHARRAHVVRDYDGTPIVVRRIVVRQGDTAVVMMATEWVQRATPHRYLNGQPVWPTTAVRSFGFS